MRKFDVPQRPPVQLELPGLARSVAIPRYDPLPVFIIKNALGTARISREHYFELLARV